MNTEELGIKIKALGISPRYYSLDGELINDASVLDKFIEDGWYRVFYLDEKGNYRKEQKIDSEEKACEYIYDLFAKP